MRLLPIIVTLAACGQEPSSCPQNLAIDLSNAVIHVYNGGTTNGAINATFTCAAGGSGSVTGDREATSYDFMVMFNGCTDTGTESSLTLTGMLHDTNNLTTHVETGHSNSLMIVGTETACTASEITASCEVDFSYTGHDSAGSPIGSGSVCGLTFP